MNNDNRRIAARFAALSDEDRAGLVAFITAGDPDFDTSLEILKGLPGAGADLIELGMPFSDPMADGPAIQAAGLRALQAGATMETTFELVRRFRQTDSDTPIVLMGYYNPVYHYGTEDFCNDAAEAGVDGLIIVDLPPEEDAELRGPADKAGLDVIRLATPTTDDARLPRVLDGAGGFLYYVAVAGVTGTKSAEATDIANAVARLRKHTDIPLGVGFGIKTPEQAADIAAHADAAVVGSAIVSVIADGCDAGKRGTDIAKDVLDFVASLSQGVRKARKAA